MILKTLLHWLWVVAGFCLGASCATMTLLILGGIWAADAFRQIAEAQGNEVLYHGSEVFGPLFFFVSVAPSLTALPALVLILVGEFFAIRSALYYLLAGGGAMAAIPFLAVPRAPGEAGTLPAGEYMIVFAAAGFVGGFVYWLIAGRRAGQTA